MLGAGTVINPIIKIVTTVAILAAAYLFIVKPVLNTTDKAFEQSFDAFGEGFGDLPGQVQEQIDDAIGSGDGSRRLQACIDDAIAGGGPPDTRRINRCVERFTG